MSCRIFDLHGNMWDLVPQPGVKPGPLALGTLAIGTLGKSGKRLIFDINFAELVGWVRRRG